MKRYLPALLILTCCLPGIVRAEDVQVRKPNVLFVLIDDMGWGDPDCYGDIGVKTPRMDQVAAEGIRFTRFYTAAPICSASRCGFITGRYPHRSKITSFLHERAENRKCGQSDFLDPAAPSFVREFHKAGYATAHIGKWHLGGGRDVNDAPKFAAYGYDLGLGTYESPEPAAALGLKTTPWRPEREPQQVPRHDRTRWMVDQALDFARKHSGKPWLINLWLDDVHTPHRPSEDALKTVENGKGSPQYRAVLKETDHQIGRLLDGLRESGLEKDTMVIVSSDNGPEPSFKRSRSGGLRGMKLSLYEGGIRTPLMVRWPGKIPAGKVNENTVICGVDFYPTLLHMAGITVPAGLDLDGLDLSAAFRGADVKREKPLFWIYGRKPQLHDAPSPFKFAPEPGAKSPCVAMLDGDWKLLVNEDGSNCELYNLSEDPLEENDLSLKRPNITGPMKSTTLEWRRQFPE
jgi:arylsulfatase A-like enzyme